MGFHGLTVEFQRYEGMAYKHILQHGSAVVSSTPLLDTVDCVVSVAFGRHDDSLNNKNGQYSS
jgi:hypothetical protein